ncbi:hypothetical protein COU18_02540 [Candidatus Kaiserbacteria bacterium CG10_big_fil_rev_8_21_14_0_10_51_14]|uniref:Uncharacterized protein n=1 Tax=Candidatus Kaiserbacteria bacterium CG10_big_fil_rev_8_21_14_0_10_51_14 TaxID=1974610 RepID=A0A2H0UB24_9BACT|nr:MAG: hypothetical protein COU18_02540 [Candidatus Kaiserbacteria bacterium CG10_big_fil_rev_8_21_14_0_10_51_14]
MRGKTNTIAKGYKMGWFTSGRVSHEGFSRRVAYDSDTGKVERSFGRDKDMSDNLTSRHVGYASSREEANQMAHDDLKDTFK